MNASAWGPTRQRVKIYSGALIIAVLAWVALAWAYQYTQNSSNLPTGKGWLDLWIQFLSGGWAGDLVEKIEKGEIIQYPKQELSYLISAGFIIQGLIPTVAAIGILAELIELRWRTTMRASGILLEQQDMMARSFREVMIKLLPKSEQENRREEMDWISQDTAYEVAERWCKQRAPREIGKKEAAQALSEIQERRALWKEHQPKSTAGA